MLMSLSWRLVQSLVLLVALSMVGFSLLTWMPGDFAELLLIEQMGDELPDAETLAAFKERHGFDDPMALQYLRWASRVVQGDLGVSFQSGDAVWADLRLGLWNSLKLGLASILVSLLLAFPIGITAALRRGGWFDKLAMALAVLGMSIPNFWLSLLLVLLFSLTLDLLPVAGYRGWEHLVLPSLVIGTALAGITARFVRSCFLEVLRTDYIRTAHAKGLGRVRLVLRHALPNALIPLITLIGLQTARLFDSFVVVETVFAWPGLGQLMVDAVLNRDFSVIQGCVLVIGVLYIVINLLVDLLIMAVDPRVRSAL